ncbi:polysaccharide biosynthesis/export family protein [Jannaschia seohaensis]|uniref:Polysaccharide export outer membrane protein n=1 Tax=Jannaschia seohaensis TaxID=475081 RepID=A0A2Y9C814_9RHOB|nr:polysaccharide biosynthesis/export family protein [Jannaschia seohaensis]PWJ17440.1 polysaccharide export outer membrane protein [Jannaschia seohaensis]SSA47503.1 polysaccharide export outer membrane protein [Jannaschia seohaensis]
MMNSLRLAILGCVLMMVTACALPRGAAVEREVLRGADRDQIGFSVYPLTRDLVPTVAEWPTVGEEELSWIATSTGSRGRIVQGGDTVSVQIWDSSENSLLTAPGTRVVALADMPVSPSGSIFIPYVGDVRIGGLSPENARRRLQSALEPIAPSAQVQLKLTEGRGNSVELIGGVAAPGPYPMPDRNYTVLSLIAAGGGVSPALQNPQIRLKRGGRLYGTSIARLYDEPQLDTLLDDGDQVIVEEEKRTFLSIGAAGAETVHTFPKDIVTAAEALSIIGGVVDSRANPQGILILREYPRSALSAGVRGPRTQQVVFTLDLTSADGLFASRNFRIAPGDMIYVTESPVVATQSVFSIIGSAFGLANTVGGGN